MKEAAPRRKPILRKEVVETKTWGEVVVRQFTGTTKMEVNANAFYPPPDDETAEQAHTRRQVQYFRMINGVLANAVVPKGSDEPLYSEGEWNDWSVQAGNDEEDGAQIQADLLKVTQKALGMNGYRLLPVGDEKVGEDVAKNA